MLIKTVLVLYFAAIALAAPQADSGGMSCLNPCPLSTRLTKPNVEGAGSSDEPVPSSPAWPPIPPRGVTPGVDMLGDLV